ncbi:hypothetical protein [Empedobacter falsenii]|uniref:hypothetical protein n=2 Tax=Empedobacter falsenii TaxID=343874 RepID=UPI0025759581|nr:hypothetical protein [Empedobacter falsenii]
MTLLDDMTEIKPKTVWFTPLTKKDIIKTSQFKFVSKNKSFGNVVTLLITWKEYIPLKDIEYLFKKNNFYFTEEEKVFYGEKIIQDITVFK